MYPRVPGNKLTQKDNADSGVQFITHADPKQSSLGQGPLPVFVKTLYTLSVLCPNPPPQIPCQSKFTRDSYALSLGS